MKKFYVIIIVSIIMNFNNFLYAQNSDESDSKDSLKQSKSDIILVIGNQFFEEKAMRFYPIGGALTNVFSRGYFKIPIEFLIYYTRWNERQLFFPKISSGIEYYPNILNLKGVFLKGTLGIPLLFYYPLDINISIGIHFHKIQLEIREIYYLEVGGQEEINLKHWPMVAILLGITL